jgi:rod shape determining protein RodA
MWGWLSFKKKYYFWIAFVSLLVSGALLASTLAHKALKEYQIMRLIVFLNPSVDPRGSGWNILQSITAIGSGGILGKGFLQGTQSHYRYLPQQSTDFIFSIIAEEWGFIGGFSVFALYYILLRRCTNLLKTANDSYAINIVAGIMGMIFFHFMLNAGMVMGIMPITGIPLFFLSYGGSSLWVIMISVGLLLGISARRYRT